MEGIDWLRLGLNAPPKRQLGSPQSHVLERGKGGSPKTYLRSCYHKKGSSLVAQMIKASVYNVGDPGSIPGLRRSPEEKEMAIHSRTIAWKIPWTEEPVRLQSMGSQRVRHDWVTSLSLFHFTTRNGLTLGQQKQQMPRAVFLIPHFPNMPPTSLFSVSLTVSLTSTGSLMLNIPVAKLQSFPPCMTVLFSRQFHPVHSERRSWA